MAKSIILNRQQKQAVRYSKRTLLVVAGAGTGKTTVITERIKYLIQKKSVSPQNILAVTFTDKAATEMLERLDLVLPLGYQEPWLGTFHSICERILRADCLEIGLDPSYKIITPVDQWILLKEHLFDFKLKFYRPLGNPTKFISALLKFMSRAQDEDVSPNELKTFSEKLKKRAKTQSEKEEATKLLELDAAYEKYQKLKINKSLLDFGDLITQTLSLFRNRKSILKKYQNQFEHILVDEFQDTNFSQYQLLKLLCPKKAGSNLIVVGDDDQSVYKWRGASISNIINFKRDHPESREIVLTKNYRSLQPILKSAYHLIQNNNPHRLEIKLNINKKLRSLRKKSTEKPIIISTPTGESEVNFTISTILELVSEENYSYKDFAVLTRANDHLNAYVSGLKRAGIPYQLIGNRGLFDQEEVRGLIHFLRVVFNPEETRILFQFLHLRIFKIKADTIFELLSQSKSKQQPLWSVIKNRKEPKIKKAANLIEKYQSLALSQSVTRLLHNFIITTGYLKDLTDKDTIENELRVKNINLFFEKLKRFEADNRNTGLTEFIETLELWLEAGENPAQAVIEDIDTINLLTVHSAKGLEFPVVFIGNLVSGRFPAVNRRDPIEFPDELIKETIPKGSETIQEERRLLYVAMTRAKDYLYLTYAADYGGVRARKKSGFLEETKLKEKEEKIPLIKDSLYVAGPPTLTVRNIEKEDKVELKFLSYSQIDTFLTCPLKYKYRYLLNVPAEPHHALTFGQSIHNTLHEFHRYQQQGKILSLSKLLSIYKKNFLELGYESESHKIERFKSGINALNEYHKVFMEFLGTPKILEKNFKLKIAETQFVGKIDRIDETKKGLEIIDYKTGNPKDQKSVDKNKQLTLYGLAAKEAFGLNIEKYSLYYIEGNLKLTTTRTEKDMQREKEYVTTVANKIRNSKFRAKPGYPFPCKFCEYNKICPYAKNK
jgi:DNA helicase-2/ATP-dependent DNA helicase PcrA